MTTPSRGKGKAASKSRHTLSELSFNNSDKDVEDDPMDDIFGNIDGQITLRYTLELNGHLAKSKIAAKDHIKNNLSDTVDHLEIVGFSKGESLPSEFYDGLFTSDLGAKKVSLRGPGKWTSCRCPSTKSKKGKLVDTISDETATNLEHIYIFRTFKITPCALLDLISRSPNLKSVRFYGSIIDDTTQDHLEAFMSVRFPCNLEAIYWPWCNVKTHKPTLRLLVKHNDKIQTLYTMSDIACDFINSDLLPNIKYLSLIMNEKWTCSPGKTKILKRYNRNINALRRADKIEALEVRTFDVNYQISLDEDGDSEMHDLIRNNFETYKLHFWENVKELPNLKYLAIYGAWELEEVTREMSKHGLQIEYFRTNLMPNSMLSLLEENSDHTSKSLVLSMSDAAKHLAKLAKLKSLHFSCNDMLSNIDAATASAMRELSDLIWKFEIKSMFTAEVEELMTNILRRGNQNGRSYRIGLLIQPEDQSFANLYVETMDNHKFTSDMSLKDSLKEFCQQKVRERFGKTAFKTYSVWSIAQSGAGRDKATFEQLKATWNFYEHIFRSVDKFV